MESKSKNFGMAATVVVISLSSLVVSFALSFQGGMINQVAVFIAGVICLTVVTAGIFILFRKYDEVDPLIYIASLFSWTCMIDIGIALELDGYISNFIGYYLAEGEPYLNTAHGTLINYWDGTVHFSLYIAIIFAFSNRLSYRELGLYWAGSILNSMIVLLPGAVTGNHPFKLSIFLNTPYLLLPIVAAFRLLHQRPPQARSFVQFPSIVKRPLDLMFLMYFVSATCVAIFRGLASLGGKFDLMRVYVKEVDAYVQDETNFPLVQVLAYLYLFVPYYLSATYGLLAPGQHWMSDWSLLHAGAAAQAQVTYFLGASHHRTISSLQPPTTGIEGLLYWVIQLALLLLPQLFALRCLCDAEMFGRSHTTYCNTIGHNGLKKKN